MNLDLAREIMVQPERNDLRLEFARTIEPRDPAWSRFIVKSLDPNWDSAEFNQPSDDLSHRLKAPFRRFGNLGVVFHRGFPSTVSMPFETFLEQGDEILSLGPILEVELSLPYLDERGFRPSWNPCLPALVNCPALARVRELTLGTGLCDFESVKHVIGSPYIDSLLRFSVGDWWFDSPAIRDQQEDEMWPLLLESPVFRRMISWGVLGTTRRHVGDRRFEETYNAYDETPRYKRRHEPMSEESRALEQRYGYIPCLHAGNWKATVLDVLRGIKPDYPAGATPTEEMYAVPPPTDTGS